MAKSPRRKSPKSYRVYVTYLPDDRYYIGFSQKSDKLFEKYFGSARVIKEYIQDDTRPPLRKEIIAQYAVKSHAKMLEFLLQWKYRDDERCLNDMIHLRLRLSYLKDFKEFDWKPGYYQRSV